MKHCFLLGILITLTLVSGENYPIKHVVVLMMENRSFDHMLGWLKRVNPEIDGLTGNETNYYDVHDHSKGFVRVGDQAPYVARWDPDHSLEGTSRKIFGRSGKGANPAPMNGFVQEEKNSHPSHKPVSDIMNMFTPDRVPIITTLATEFALCDRYFASVPGPTHPNRLFALSATSHGAINNDVPHGGFPQDTIFDRLEEAGKSWNLFYTDNVWALMLGHLRTKESVARTKPWAEFLKAAKEGKLPHYSWLEPRFASSQTHPSADQHPDHLIPEGERTMKEVYEHLRHSPQWNETLLIITYDEHGGFYDHYPTPQNGVPNPDGRSPHPALPSGFNFDRSGIRVPIVFVSPWVNKGTVLHEPTGPHATSQYEHSSIPATLKKLFGTKSFLTKRDEWAGTFESVFMERKTPRTDCLTKLPDVPAPTPQEIFQQANQPVNDLMCDYIKAFPGSHKNCNMTQHEASKYSLHLLDKLFANVTLSL